MKLDPGGTAGFVGNDYAISDIAEVPEITPA